MRVNFYSHYKYIKNTGDITFHVLPDFLFARTTNAINDTIDYTIILEWLIFECSFEFSTKKKDGQ